MTYKIETGGKNVYGASVGILMLESTWPRIMGDTGHAGTWPFPVLYKVVRGATAHEVVNNKGKGLNSAFIDAAIELVKDGADGITTTGGFLSLFQRELATHTGVPVASSSLMQIPLVQNMLPPGKRVGILTIHGKRLGAEHLIAAGAPADTPIVGTENGREFTRALLGNESSINYALVELDMLDAGREMLRLHPDVGALVLECHNMAPYSRKLKIDLGIPVFDVYTFVKWFHSGLEPRNFNAPSSVY